jgi:hypothetical protein
VIDRTPALTEKRPIRLGLRQNIVQFGLPVLVNAFMGAMVGMERSILPAIAEHDFQFVARYIVFDRGNDAVRAIELTGLAITPQIAVPKYPPPAARLPDSSPLKTAVAMRLSSSVRRHREKAVSATGGIGVLANDCSGGINAHRDGRDSTRIVDDHWCGPVGQLQKRMALAVGVIVRS